MAGLLVIFILASLALILELLETKDKVNQSISNIFEAEEIRRSILREIQEELKQKNILVEVSDNESVLRVPEDQLAFETDQFRIPPEKSIQVTVAEIGKILYERIAKDERWRFLDTIFIEGHTDSRTSNREMGNWGLSAYRAISIWDFWLEMLPDDYRLENILNHNGEKLFSVSGYAATRPVVELQKSESDYIKNRRIDIRITVKKPTREELRSAINPISDL